MLTYKCSYKPFGAKFFLCDFLATRENFLNSRLIHAIGFGYLLEVFCERTPNEGFSC